MATEAFVKEEAESSLVKGVPETVSYTLVSGTWFTYNFNLGTIQNIYGSDVKMADVLFYSASYDNDKGSGGQTGWIKEDGVVVAIHFNKGSWNEMENGQIVPIYPGKSYQAHSGLLRGTSTQVRVIHIYR